MKTYDRIIIGGGLYGLYSLLKSVQQGMHVLLIEKEPDSFLRASFVNQARVHCGMHYLRSLETARQCARYFNRFVEEHKECINQAFRALYVNSKNGSLVSDSTFISVLESLNINYRYITPPDFMKSESISICAQVEEVSVDAKSLVYHYLSQIAKYGGNADIHYGESVTSLQINNEYIEVNSMYKSDYVLNCTYASINDIIRLFTHSEEGTFDLRYELCEVVLCNVADSLKGYGLTVMDGPFFSLMPFGYSGYHSLTSVGHTPHYSCEGRFPSFLCQSGNCHLFDIRNCNQCDNRPKSCYPKMLKTVLTYLKPNLITQCSSLYAIKPILTASEINDARPTVIVQHSSSPFFYSVLSGKLSSLYEMDSIL